jgi:hypothetical protein
LLWSYHPEICQACIFHLALIIVSLLPHPRAFLIPNFSP